MSKSTICPQPGDRFVITRKTNMIGSLTGINYHIPCPYRNKVYVVDSYEVYNKPISNWAPHSNAHTGSQGLSVTIGYSKFECVYYQSVNRWCGCINCKGVSRFNKSTYNSSTGRTDLIKNLTSISIEDIIVEKKISYERGKKINILLGE